MILGVNEMIKFATGFCGPGGSTVAISTLINLFNDNGLDACLYGGGNPWNGIDCKFDTINNINLQPEDIFIYHYMAIQNRMNCKKQILSCHETVVFPIKNVSGINYDEVHFVSQAQKEFQDVEGTVIPNPIRSFTKADKTGKKVAGVIGSIDPNKRVEESIQRALNDGFTDIRIYGNLTDPNYFRARVLPLMSDNVTYRGVASNMDKVYSELTHVYHSPKLESFNLLQFECKEAGVEYVGNEGNDTKAEHWDNDKILEAWKKLLT